VYEIGAGAMFTEPFLSFARTTQNVGKNNLDIFASNRRQR
jgi:hypothetical protein